MLGVDAGGIKGLVLVVFLVLVVDDEGFSGDFKGVGGMVLVLVVRVSVGGAGVGCLVGLLLAVKVVVVLEKGRSDEREL